MALIYNATFDKNTRKLSFEDRAGNEIYSFIVPERGSGSVDDITKPLTFKATQDGSTVKLTKYGRPSGDFQTSRDGGNTWTDYTIGASITINTGEEVSFRAKSDRTSPLNSNNYFQFNMTGKIEAWHNVMSMQRTNDFATYNTAITLSFSCLFQDCDVLTKAPVLPATTLESSCYSRMFYGCRSLTKAPELPATTLAGYCYFKMFSGCQSLIKAPELPATALAKNCHYCYTYMFSGCRSLTKAPELPATTLTSNCYSYMFDGCLSLTKAPELPATTLAQECYRSMFSGCQSLKEVRVSATTTATDALTDWLKDVSATGDFYCNPNATIFPTDSASGIPQNWRRLNINEEAPAVDDITKPLTFKATLDGSTVKLTKNGSPDGDFQTSRDGGNTWTDYTLDSAITLNTGEEVSFRAKADRTKAQSRESHFYFQMTGEIEAWHNVMSLYRTNDFATYNTMVESSFNRLFFNCYSLTKAPVLPSTTLATDCYEYMFQSCQSLTKAPELPATTLVNGCYSSMFYGCQSLAEAPELPATKLADFCYYDMFDGCPSLTKAPELPATTLAYSCYSHMFVGCRSLTKAPELPATTLSSKCYAYMFSRCQSLTKAPELPATTLANNCYQYMFSNCYSLTKAPELPATTLNSKCYQYMFSGCQSLKEVRIAATTTATDALTDWLKDVSATGDFYCDPNATIFPTDSTSGIPANWRRLNINEEGPAVDDITKPLTFKATQDGSTVKLTKKGSPSGDFQTSRDGGNTWSDYTIGTAITLNTGDEVSFRAKSDRTSAQESYNYFYFEMTGKIEAWHNVMSMIRTNDFATYNYVMRNAFYYLFEGCTSLTKAPVLPATTLDSICYNSMFGGCQSLTKAPELPATTLASYCYFRMFAGCRSLKEVRVSATTTEEGALTDWLKDVSATGDFYCDPNATIFPTGKSGIPANWTRRNIADYPN